MNAAKAYQRRHPGVGPEGANDFSCRPLVGQRPVVLIPGTDGSAYSAWAGLSPQLAESGWCVFTFDYSPLEIIATSKNSHFNGDIRESAAALGHFVDRVLKATGASQVDLVGHSQGGGPLPWYYLTELGGQPRVHTLVALAPSHRGLAGPVAGALLDAAGARQPIETAAGWINADAYPQQLPGSALNDELYGAPLVAPAGVHHVIVASAFDLTVRPRRAFIAEPGVENILLQDVCPASRASHTDLPYDPAVQHIVRNALLERAEPVRCSDV